ncbi:MAG: hypothetical protein QM773_13835 [Hyphomonadaceae bacterium]
MDYQVTRWRPDGADRDRTIDLLEVFPGPLYLPPWQVASMIYANDNFYVESSTYGRVYLEVGRSGLAGHWVRTYPNGIFDDNIYALPKF